MKNGDMPAMPMPLGADGRIWTASDLDNGYAEQCRPAFGLTKREMFAMHIMAGMAHGYNEWKYMAEDAVAQADALLLALEETK